MVQLAFRKMYDDVVLPQRATSGSACVDIHAYIHIEDRWQKKGIQPRGSTRFHTGLVAIIPAGHALMIYSRSGHGFRNDIRLSNCVGVIDSDYTGEIMVKLAYDACMAESEFYRVHHGDRIAQAMLIEVPQFEVVETTLLQTTARGAGGLGSTGA